jgi:hypothetical protein
MPGHFTHIYTARRVSDLLLSGSFTDWPEGVNIPFTAKTCGQVMRDWEKFTAIGAIGPDLFYFSQDYNTNPGGLPIEHHSDDLMFALATYYYFDAAGEDDWEPLLEILSNDVSSTMAAIIRFLIELKKIWDAFVAGWDATIGPIVDAVGQSLDDLTGGVLSQAQVVIDELKTAFVALVEQELLTFKDIMGSFDTCVSKGWQERSFLWSDMSHYRLTSAMCQALVRQAERVRSEDHAHGADVVQPDARFEQMLAFALGYVTHVGTDTVAHSFVNEQCGGPYRNHPQRHHLIENHIDAWNYRQGGAGGTIPTDPWAATDDYPELSMSALYFMVQLTGDEADPTDQQGMQRPSPLPTDPTARKQALDVDGKMPGWMCDAIVLAMIDAFDDRPHPLIFGGSNYQAGITEGTVAKAVQTVTGAGPDTPWHDLAEGIAPTPSFPVPPGFPMPWEIQTMYRIMISFYKFSFTGSWELEKPQSPDPIIVPPASDVENLFQPPDFSGVDSSNPVADVCEALLALVEWVGKELGDAAKLAGDLVKMVVSPLTYPLREGLYEIAMAVWDVITKTHEVLAHTGFMIPHGEQLYPETGELRLPNEIDLPLITLGGTVDGAFQQALADAFDPLANLDKDPSLFAAGHPIPDSRYPLNPVWLLNTDVTESGSIEYTPSVGVEYKRPWDYPDMSEAIPLGGGNPELYDPNLPNLIDPGLGPFPTSIVAGPYPAGVRPDDVFFRTDAPVDPAIRARYEHSQTPAETDILNHEYLLDDRRPVSPLGDPVPFSAYLIGQLANSAQKSAEVPQIADRRVYDTQFNLDSDRNYAYLTWDWLRGEEGQGTTSAGDDYTKPNVPPQNAPDWVEGTTFQLEFIDVPRKAQP